MSASYNRRRKIESIRTLTRQISQGRPSSYWQSCNIESCEENLCSHKDGAWILEDKDQNKFGSSVEESHSGFVYTLASVMWPDVTRSDERWAKAQSIAAFLHSPIVRQNLWKVDNYMTNHHPFMGSMHFPSELENVVQGLRRLLRSLQEEPAAMYQDYWIPNGFLDRKQRALNRFLIEIAMNMEQWRQYSLWFRPEWDFTGNPSIIAQLYPALFLYMWDMSQDGCFQSLELTHEFERARCWDQWYNAYPPQGSVEMSPHIVTSQTMNAEGYFELSPEPVEECLRGSGKGQPSLGLEESRELKRKVKDILFNRPRPEPASVLGEAIAWEV